MARVRTARNPEQPTEIPQDDADPDFLTPEQSIANAAQEVDQPSSKAEMVRIAMAQGIDNPTDGVAFLKSRFGVDLPKPMWSSYVAQQRARERKAGGEIQPRQSRTQSGGQSAVIPPGFGEDIKTLKGLIEKAGGAEELQELVGSLGGLVSKYGQSGLADLIEAFG
jgi:hypothetical protein